jgi:tetratricopeptide (TPR) repeat protein
LTVWLERNQVGASGIEFQLTALDRVAIAGRALWFYAGKLVWPEPLIFIYPRWPTATEQPWQLGFPVAFLVAVGVLWWQRARFGRGPLVAVLLFAGILLPALGFFDVYPMRYSYVADHFQYLASAALLTSLAALGTVLVRRVVASRRLAAALGVLVCALLATLTLRQSLVYASPESLWRDTIVKNPTAWMAMNNLAYELQQQGRAREAVPYIQDAIRINPNCLECYGNLADAYRASGDEASAKQVFVDLAELLLRQQRVRTGQQPEPPGSDGADAPTEE